MLDETKIKLLIGNQRLDRVREITIYGSPPTLITVELRYPYVNESPMHVWEWSEDDTEEIYVKDLIDFIDDATKQPTNPSWASWRDIEC